LDREPGRTRVHEHAETGKPVHPSDEYLSLGAPVPLAAYKLHGTHGRIRENSSRSNRAKGLCRRQRWNGPAGFLGAVGHKISANGLP
jgi:hypothetical protein